MMTAEGLDVQANTRRAYRVKDGCIYEAWQLKDITGLEDGEHWLCAHGKCSALMDPVAWRRLKEDGSPYRKPAHFSSRDVNQHHQECRTPVEKEITATSYHGAHQEMRVPEEIPSRVSFRFDQEENAGPSSEEPKAADPKIATANRSVPSGSAFVPEGTGSTKQSTIRKCCKIFLESDAHHNHPLSVDDCFGGQYGSVFAPLLPPREPLLLARRVFYAEALMKGLRDRAWPGVTKGTIRIPLLATVPRAGQSQNRYLEIDVSKWKPEAAADFARRAREAAEAGWVSYCQGGKQKPWVFFVGVLEDPRQLVIKVDQEAMVEVLLGEKPPHAFHEAEAPLRRRQANPRFTTALDLNEAAATPAGRSTNHDEVSLGLPQGAPLNQWDASEPPVPTTMPVGPSSVALDEGDSPKEPIVRVEVADLGNNGIARPGEGNSGADLSQVSPEKDAEPPQKFLSSGLSDETSDPNGSDPRGAGSRTVDTESERDDQKRDASHKASHRPTKEAENPPLTGQFKPDLQASSESFPDMAVSRGEDQRVYISRIQRIKNGVSHIWRRLVGSTSSQG